MQAHYVDPAHLTPWAPESVVCGELMEICHILRVAAKDSPPIIRSQHVPWTDAVSVEVVAQEAQKNEIFDREKQERSCVILANNGKS